MTCCMTPVRLSMPTLSLEMYSGAGCSLPLRRPALRIAEDDDNNDWLCSGMDWDQTSSAGISSVPSTSSHNTPRVNKNPFSTPSPYPKKREAAVATPESASRRVRQRFQVEGVMRREATGVVYSALHRVDGEEYGLKVIVGEANEHELPAMAACTDLQRVLMYTNAWTEHGDMYIQLEAAEHTLADMEGAVDTEQIAELAAAVLDLHARGYCLNNITATSVVLVDGEYKLADFSCAAPYTPEGAEADMEALAALFPEEA